MAVACLRRRDQHELLQNRTHRPAGHCGHWRFRWRRCEHWHRDPCPCHSAACSRLCAPTCLRGAAARLCATPRDGCSTACICARMELPRREALEKAREKMAQRAASPVAPRPRRLKFATLCIGCTPSACRLPLTPRSPAPAPSHGMTGSAHPAPIQRRLEWHRAGAGRPRGLMPSAPA